MNKAANDSAQVTGQDRKKLPALGTNQIAGFGGFRPLASLEKIDVYIYLSGFDKRYLQKFLATVSFEVCSVLDHSCFVLFLNDLFSTKIPLKAAVDQKTCV